MSGRKLIVLVDGTPGNPHVAEWQRQALARLPSSDQITLLVCTNTRLKPKLFKHPLYYALNLLCVRNRLTRQVGITGIAANIVEERAFESGYEGNWQTLPQDIVEFVDAAQADAIIKLGLGLMRVPAEMDVPILSWHHGDPEHFRGRPSGFWEIATGHPLVGQMVQQITNRLDGGKILAFAETQVFSHSWKKTLLEAFTLSPLLLESALHAALSGASVDKPTTGRNYRLPSNFQVLRVCAILFMSTVRRLVYGAFWEKGWRVSLAPAPSPAADGATGAQPLATPAEWDTLPLPERCSFIADPFFDASASRVLVEALRKDTGVGALYIYAGAECKPLTQVPRHYSYPAGLWYDGVHYCIPETAQWATPKIYRLEPEWAEVAELRIEGSPRITDPTLLHKEGMVYLFGSTGGESCNILRLWSSDSLFGQFTEHPASPVRMSPRGARMAGQLLDTGETLIRLGQDFSRDYGDGVIAFAVDKLDPRLYEEREIGALRFDDRKGPHTFNVSPDGSRIVFDWYHDVFSPFAGLRRLVGKMRRS